MRWLIVLASVFLLISCSSKDTVLHDTEGHEIHLAQLKSDWIIINYWASWCESCLYEVPELNHFVQTHPEVSFYGVNYDQLTGDELKQAMLKSKIAYPVVTDNVAQMFDLDQVELLPTTFILNHDGKVMTKIVGPTSEEKLLETLQSLKHD